MCNDVFMFRGVKLNEKKFVYGLPTYNELGVIDTLVKWDFIHNELIREKILAGSLSQCTGCETDHNDGKLIYDGDTIEFTMPDEPFWGYERGTRKIGTVRYESDYGGYIIEWEWDKNQHHVNLDCDIATGAIIIGNKWDIKTNIEDLFDHEKVDISDLSFSGIVDYIQHDGDVAKKFLIKVIDEKNHVEKVIDEVTDRGSILRDDVAEYRVGIERVIKHMKYKLPLLINDKNRVIEIDEDLTIKIKNNII